MARKRTGVSGPYKHGRRWRVVRQTDGTREVDSFQTEAEARAFIDEWRTCAQGETVSGALDRWIGMLERKEVASSTLLARRGQIQRLIPKIPPTMPEVTPLVAQAAYEELQRDYAADTHRMTLKAARQMWRDLNGRSAPNPWREVTPAGKPKKGKVQLTVDESRAFLASALQIAEYQKGGVAAALCLTMALRSSEIVSLKGRDIDDGGRLLWVQRGKTESARRCLEVPDVLQAHLVRLAKAAGPRGLLFTFDRRSVYYHVEQVCDAANVTKVCPHGLRGTHATIARSAGATAHIVAAALGHSSPAVTHAHYIAPGTEEMLGIRAGNGTMRTKSAVPTGRN
jgi:integrase